MSTKIEWTTETWNPVTGCTQLSAGCANCYAKTIALQMQKNGVRKYVNGFTVTMHEYALNMPRLLREPSFIFVCSMADLFHKDVPFEFIDKVMAVIRSTPQHTYQILTKRAERMAEYFTARAIPANVWLGVSVEASDVKHRIDSVRNLPASIRFLSCEPLVEDLGELDLTNIKLGNRRRRTCSQRTTDERTVGAVDKRSDRETGSVVLLQAMGKHRQGRCLSKCRAQRQPVAR